MKVLLTGASGYVGPHLTRALLGAGHAVTALVRVPARLGPLRDAPGVAVVELDLDLDRGSGRGLERALEGHDACVHAALIWGPPGEELEARDTAVAARLFDAAGRAGLSRCLYLSSTAVHRPFRAEMGEDDPLRPADVYGATKAAGELFLHAAAATHAMTGVVLRAGPVVGPPAFAGGAFRGDHRLAELVASARASRPIEVLEGAGRQWIDVRALAEATRLLLEAERPEGTVLCVDRAPIPWAWIARAAVAAVGSASPVHVLPRASPEPEPRFRTARIERLLGAPTDAREAMVQHLRQLAGG